MKIIKLSAIDSTNSFLKDLALTSTLENFTTVATDCQLNGRGQQGSSWESEPNKNLMFSVFLRFQSFEIAEKSYLNFAVSLAVYETLLAEKIPNIAIKWPNDILSGNKKICGILIENNLKGTEITSAVIGIGLNVNQIDFPATISKVSSLQLLCGKNFDRDILLEKIVFNLKRNIALLKAKEFYNLEAAYLDVLYKKNIPTMFKDHKNTLFMGMVVGISKEGKLQVALEDERVLEFGIKEISFL
ncbi:putative biotin--(acetyl-CoA carboxylase) synthetase [Polaribacter irgensii 23-P]|uniref:Putative biotin--(Acetyl-CoA carboxylase) synthetase n=1 Tax=Polaribacter irgensii 23-P TaxID=313594 RepID=A4BZ17_9FLAO|nr:biotin--[acetyl-CoA-carboxylase] ligase [Polaribacter irgensii]EAR12410.1 putative biotin--(acetyl-CoA carboxylase) synthetase [Polaribacter irgensii 23-P]